MGCDTKPKKGKKPRKVKGVKPESLVDAIGLEENEETEEIEEVFPNNDSPNGAFPLRQFLEDLEGRLEDIFTGVSYSQDFVVHAGIDAGRICVESLPLVIQVHFKPETRITEEELLKFASFISKFHLEMEVTASTWDDGMDDSDRGRSCVMFRMEKEVDTIC